MSPKPFHFWSRKQVSSGSFKKRLKNNTPMLYVDPWHWLAPNGDIPTENQRLRKNLLAVLRVIEYGSPLNWGATRDTLIECNKRPGGRRCIGLLRVEKT